MSAPRHARDGAALLSALLSASLGTFVGGEASAQAGGQRAGAGADSAPSACWRFSFGDWVPSLEWARAGHAGDAAKVAKGVERLRDSIYDRDPAARANAMTIERTRDGMLVMLYPPWWPVGVRITFDSSLNAGREMRGTALAMVADGRTESPRAPARALQVDCR